MFISDYSRVSNAVFLKKINKSDFVGYNGYTTDKPVKENQSPRKNVSLNYNTVITKGGPTKLQL